MVQVLLFLFFEFNHQLIIAEMQPKVDFFRCFGCDSAFFKVLELLVEALETNFFLFHLLQINKHYYNYETFSIHRC